MGLWTRRHHHSAAQVVDLSDEVAAVADHETRLDAAEGTITSHGSRLTTAEGDITTIDGRVTTLEGAGGGDELGSDTGVATQVAVTNTSTQIVAARATRRSVLVTNRQTVPVYIEVSGSAATTDDFRLDPEESLTIPVKGAVFGITSAAYTAVGDAKVHVMETYDA